MNSPDIEASSRGWPMPNGAWPSMLPRFRPVSRRQIHQRRAVGCRAGLGAPCRVPQPTGWPDPARIGLPTYEPVPFGRVKTDAGRLEAIERERHTDPAALLERVRSSLAEVTEAVRAFAPDAWGRRGAHPSRGDMTVQRIIEQFIVEHLEEHAEQLDQLKSGA